MSGKQVRRPINGVALVFGLIFVGLSGGWFFVNHGILDLSDLSWAVPSVLALSGIVGLVVSVTRGRAARR